MVLHSVGPKDMGEDEHRIGSGYNMWAGPLLGAIPLVAAYFQTEIKWVIAIGLAVIIAQIHEAGGRLYDLCIRLRRTNILISTAGQTETAPIIGRP
jgi:hypothetical protein